MHRVTKKRIVLAVILISISLAILGCVDRNESESIETNITPNITGTVVPISELILTPLPTEAGVLPVPIITATPTNVRVHLPTPTDIETSIPQDSEIRWPDPAEHSEPKTKRTPIVEIEIPTQTPDYITIIPDIVITISRNPFMNEKLYVNPNSDAQKLADLWRNDKPEDAALLDKIARQPRIQWILGDQGNDTRNHVDNIVTTIARQRALPVLVTYNIPQRDCGNQSAGGSGSAEAYKRWIHDFAQGVGNRKAVVILEPDALAGMDCLSGADQNIRLELMRDAVQALNAQKNISVYIDAGHSNWKNATEIADRLKKAGIDQARGFSLNVANFGTTEDNINYGMNISSLVGEKYFIIDTGRNGLGPTSDYQACNPPDRALGTPPTTETNNSLVDAYLWVKVPGESDGECNGGPKAGIFWPEYALGLAKRASW